MDAKNWCFWTVMLEKTLEHPLDCKEIQLVHPKGNQSWTFIGSTDAESETSILWSPNVKNWLNGKDPDAGKDWRWEERRMRQLDGIPEWLGRSLSKLQELVMDRKASPPPTPPLQYIGLQRVRHNWVTELTWTDMCGFISECQFSSIALIVCFYTCITLFGWL